MPVEVTEEMVVVGSGGGVSVPFLDVVCKQGFISVLDHLCVNAIEVFFEVSIEALVKVLAQEVCYIPSAINNCLVCFF